MKEEIEYPSLKPGKSYELTQNANCIPKGVYRFMEEVEGMLFFNIDNQITWGVSANFMENLKPIPEAHAALSRTTVRDFVNRYFPLYEKYREEAPRFDPAKPLTICLIDPSLQQSVQMLN